MKNLTRSVKEACKLLELEEALITLRLRNNTLTILHIANESQLLKHKDYCDDEDEEEQPDFKLKRKILRPIRKLNYLG